MMIKVLSHRISHYLILNGATEEEEVLAYGVECFLNEVLSNGLLIIIGILTHHVLELLVWSVSFCLLRVNMGGLHATSHAWCIAIGTLIGAASLVISPFLLQHIWFASVLTLMAVITAGFIAPVPHQHKQHVQVKKEAIKRRVIVTAVLEGVVALILYFLLPVIASYVISGLLMATILALAGVIWNPR